MLAEQANLTDKQVNEWFKNRRKRYSKLNQEQHQNYAISLSSSQGFTPSTSAYQHSEILIDAPTMAISEYDNAPADWGSFSDVNPGMASPTLLQEHQASRRSSSSPSLQRYISASPQQDPGPSGLFNSLKNSDEPLRFHTANYNNHYPNTGDRISHEGIFLPNDSKQTLVVSQSSHSGSGSVKRKGKRKHRLPQIAKTRECGKKFQCTECYLGFPSHSSRVRHLKSQHYKQQFICMCLQPFLNDVHGCIFCDPPIISDEEAVKNAPANGYLVNDYLVDQESFDNHLSAQHKIHKCSQKSEVERSFPRKDSFERHLQVIHRASASASKKLSARWQKPVDQEEYNRQRWCGFCQLSLASPKECETHVSSHFADKEKYFDMNKWHRYGEGFSSEALGQDHTADPGSFQSSYDQHFDYYDPSFEQDGGLLVNYISSFALLVQR